MATDSPRPLADWMTERGLAADDLLRACPIEQKVLTAILQGRYTPSPQQRQHLATALGVPVEQIAFGHIIEVQHLHGHGPQFGRTP